LVSRGMFDLLLPHGVHFPGQDESSQTVTADGLGPSASDRLAVPESWAPFPTERVEDVDVIIWNPGFRAALKHLAPLHPRTRGCSSSATVPPVRPWVPPVPEGSPPENCSGGCPDVRNHADRHPLAGTRRQPRRRISAGRESRVRDRRGGQSAASA